MVWAQLIARKIHIKHCMHSHFTICTGKPLNQWKKSHQIPLNIKESPKSIGVEKNRSFFNCPWVYSPRITKLNTSRTLTSYAMKLVSPLKTYTYRQEGERRSSKIGGWPTTNWHKNAGNSVHGNGRSTMSAPAAFKHLQSCVSSIIGYIFSYCTESRVATKTYCVGLLTRTLPHA